MTQQVNRHENYEQIVAGIHKNLVKFGYTDLTKDQVQEAYDRAMAGEDPKGIIDMMTKSQLEQNGLLSTT